LLRQGLREAAEILARSGSDSERDARLQYLRGELTGADGRPLEALSIYSRLAPYSDLRNATTRQILASLATLARQQMPAEAERQLVGILKSQPNDRLLLLAGVELAARQNKFDEAFSYLDRLDKLQPNGVEVPFRRAQVLARKGDFAAAATEARRAIASEADHIPSRLLLARLLAQLNDPLAALEQVERVIELRPGTADAYVLEAWSLDKLDRRDEALKVLRDQVQQRPADPNSHLALASMLRQAGQAGESLQVLRDAFERMPTNRVLAEPLILILCESGRADEAFSLARRFAGDRPDAKSAVYLAELFLRGRAFEQSRKLGQYALRMTKGPAQITIRMLLAENCLQQHQATGDKSSLPEAREHYAAVLQDQPQNLVAANNLAWLLAEALNEPEDALRLVRSIRDQIPEERLPESMLDTFLIVYRKLGLMNEALLLAESALARHPESAMLNFQAGFVYLQVGKSDAAKAALDKALALGLPNDRSSAAREELDRLEK
jgi:predicted Zn-dependent protease